MFQQTMHNSPSNLYALIVYSIPDCLLCIYVIIFVNQTTNYHNHNKENIYIQIKEVINV